MRSIGQSVDGSLRHRRDARLISVLALAMLFGCRSLHHRDPAEVSRDQPGAAEKDAEEAHSSEIEKASAEAKDEAVSTAAASAPSQAESSVKETVAELIAAGVLDRAQEEQLTADLEKTDPALRGQVVQLLRSSIAANRSEKTTNPTVDESRPIQDEVRVADLPPARLERQAANARQTADASARPMEEIKLTSAAASPDQEVLSKSPATAEQPTAALDKPDASANKTSPSDTKASASPEAVKTESARTEIASEKKSEPANDPSDWHDHLHKAIDGLSSELGSKPENADDVGRHAMLRLLQVVGGDREGALRPMTAVPPTQQDFWSKELFGLASYLDVERNPNTGRRATEAVVHLRDATARLGELANLSLRNLAICSEVKSYGIYKKFDKYEFTAGQEVLVYAEVENFKSVSTDKGYHTTLKTSYEILDQKGARVAVQEFPVTEEHCQNPRRDYFIRYFVTMPANIYGGTYSLHLYVVDEHSHKMDHGSLEFTVPAKSN